MGTLATVNMILVDPDDDEHLSRIVEKRFQSLTLEEASVTDPQ